MTHFKALLAGKNLTKNFLKSSLDCKTQFDWESLFENLSFNSLMWKCILIFFKSLTEKIWLKTFSKVRFDFKTCLLKTVFLKLHFFRNFDW